MIKLKNITKTMTFFKCNVLVFVALLLTFSFLTDKASAERVYLNISAADVRKVVVAVPAFPFTGSPAGNQKGKEMAQLLGRALEIHGFIDLVDTSRYAGVQNVDWRALGVDYAVMGKFTQSGKEMVIEGRLLDVAENRLLAGRRYRGAASQQDDMILRLADGLIEEFTGEPGISRTSIAYVSDVSGRKEIYISDILGQNQRQITKHKHLAVSPRFTPDGNYLAYTTYHRGNQDLYITDLRQNKVTRSLSRRKGMNLAPAFSPDGKSMIVTLSKDGGPDLYLLDRKGKILKRITSRSGINVSASYAPDGKKIVFVSDRSGQPQVYTMDLKSGNVRRLTFKSAGTQNSEPNWSPKGDLIAFSGLVDGHNQIFTMDPQGNNVKRLTTSWGDYESPSWSPDGKLLTFTRRRNGKSEICIIGKNGKGLKVLFPYKGNKSYPQWSPYL